MFKMAEKCGWKRWGGFTKKDGSSCASGKIKSYLGYKWVKEIINQGNFNF